MVGFFSSRYATALYSLELGSVSPTHESPLAAPRPVTRRAGTLRIKSFCGEVQDRDRGCVLTGNRVLKPHMGKLDMFEAGHIFPLALEPHWDAYDFTPKLFALPREKRTIL